MIIERRPYPVAFEGGVDTKTDPRHVIPAKVLAAENLYRAKSKEWLKRAGTSALTTTSSGRSITAGKKLAARGRELVLLTNNSLQAYSADQGKWIDRAKIGNRELALNTPTHSIQHVHSAILQSTFDLVGTDVAYGSGLICYVWEHTNSSVGIQYAIIEEATGQVLRSATSLGQTRPKVVFAEGFFLIFRVSESGASSELRVTRVSAADLTEASSVAVASDLLGTGTGTPWYDVHARSDNGNVLVAYRGTGPNLRALEWDPTTNTASIAAVTVVASDVAQHAVGWMDHDGSGGSWYLATAVNSATGVVVRTLNSSTLAQTATTTVQTNPGDVANITGYRDTGLGSSIVFYEVRATPTQNSFVIMGIGGSISSLQVSCGLASKVFRVSGTPYVMLAYEGTLPTYFIAEGGVSGGPTVTNGIQSRILRLDGGGLTVNRNTLSHAASISSTRFVIGARKSVDVLTLAASTSIKRGIVGVDVDFSGVLGNPTEFSRSLLIPAGNPLQYDGVYPYEAGFHLDPEPPTLALAAGGGLGIGAYRYKIVYTWHDAEGRLHRSSPSTSATITTSGGNLQITVTFANLRVNGRRSLYGNGDTGIEIYRTLVGGTAFFRHPVLRINDPTSDTTAFTDSTADADLAVGLPLYTDGGELENHPPPPAKVAIMVKDRMVVIDAENPKRIWASKPLVDGLGLAFHPDLSVLEDDGGGFTALANLDGQIIGFKAGSIYAIPNTWPNNIGQGDLPEPRRISNALGTDEPETIAVTPDGIWFRDPDKGQCFLDRAGQAAPMTDTAAFDALDVSAAVLVPHLTQVRFVSTTGRTLVWDYVEKHWYTFTGWSAVSAAVANGVFYYLKSNGTVVKEDTAIFSDEGASYTCLLDLSWLQLLGLQGEQWTDYIQLTGDHFANVILTVALFYDFIETIVDTRTFDMASIAASSKWEAQAECSQVFNKALRARLSFSSTNQGIGFSGAALMAGAAGNLIHLPKAKIA